jgi:hypothetical protein
MQHLCQFLNIIILISYARKRPAKKALPGNYYRRGGLFKAGLTSAADTG